MRRRSCHQPSRHETLTKLGQAETAPSPLLVEAGRGKVLVRSPGMARLIYRVGVFLVFLNDPELSL